MNKQMNFILLVGVMILTACGQLGTAAPANNPEPTVIPSPVENTPTAVLAHGSDSDQFRKYIGSTHPPLPEGLSEGFGMLIQNVDGYGLRLVSDGANKMLWLDKITHYDSNGTAYWEVKDVLALSNLETGLTLVPDGCSLNGAPDSEIFVASKNGTIRFAWRANTALDRFEVIPTNGIECLSDKATDI